MPGEIIPGLKLTPGATIRVLGVAQGLPWHQDGANVVIDKMPGKLPCDYAWSVKIRKSDIIR